MRFAGIRTRIIKIDQNATIITGSVLHQAGLQQHIRGVARVNPVDLDDIETGVFALQPFEIEINVLRCIYGKCFRCRQRVFIAQWSGGVEIDRRARLCIAQ